MKRLIFFILSISLSAIAVSQNTYPHGDFTIKNFSTNEYNGVAQNWDITQDEKGLIYISNSSGILVYNGVNWIKKKLDNQESVLSIDYSTDSSVYLGGDMEFGKIYFQNGTSKYEKLSSPYDSIGISKVWHTFSTSKNVYFLSHDILYIYNKLEETFDTSIPPKNTFIKSGVIYNDQLLITYENDLGDKYYTSRIYNGNNYTKITQEQPLILPQICINFKKISYIINQKGLYFELKKNQYDQYEFISTNNRLKFKENVPINCITLKDSLLAVGTSGQGIYLFNKNGEYIRSFKEEDGLLNLEIRQLFFDRQSNLWSCNDNGISLINLSNPITKFGIDKGITATTEDLYFSENIEYLGTRSDLFVSSIDIKSTKKSFINTNTFNMEVYQIKTFNFPDGKEKTLIIANDGVYTYENKIKVKIAELWAWDLYQSKIDSNRIWVGLDGDGLGSLYYSNGKFTVENSQINNTEGEVRKVIEFQNQVYYSVKNLGIVKLDSNKNQNENVLDGLIDYSTTDSESEYQQFTLSNFNDKMFVGTDNGLYIYDGQTLMPYNDELNAPHLKIHRIYNQNNKKLWLIIIENSDMPDENVKIGYIDFEDSSTPLITSPFKSASKEVIQSIKAHPDGTVWFGGLKEIYVYNPNTPLHFLDSFPVYLESIHLNSDSVFANYQFSSTQAQKQIKYRLNTITFHFCTPSFYGNSANMYTYYLEGLDSDWSDWTNKTDVNYQRLTEGTYTFHLKAKNYYGVESSELTYTFIILPPWYRSWWAYLLYFISSIVLLVLIIRLSISRVKKQNERLEQIVEERTAEIESKNQLLESKNQEIEHKNQDIVDSIKYAKRIQNTILPTSEKMDSILKDYFVIYKPKDIVSGDFYWADELDNKAYFSVIDCTGHGVPGAFVSIVGFNGIKRVVNEFKERIPGRILDRLTQVVVSTFKASESSVKDGMDLALCSIDYNTLELEFAGANNSAVIIRKGVITELKGNKQPIGEFDGRQAFTTQKFQLEKGDCIYLFSDGFADQFGGPKGKKFKIKNLKNLLIDVSILSINQQGKRIEERFHAWKGDLEQLDDVCLMGIKIND